jgi:hypothetical protein
MEWRILWAGAIAAAAAACIILLEFWLLEKDSWGDEHKELVAAFSTALTTAIGAFFVKGAESFDKNWLGDHIKKAFQGHLNNVFPSGSVGEVALHRRQGAWDRSDRRERVEIIARELPRP